MTISPYVIGALCAKRRSAAAPDPNIGVTVTWNASDKGANITLSNGNLSASWSASGTQNLVRANTHRSTGKWYFEYKIEATNNTQIGSARGRPGLGVTLGSIATSGQQIGITGDAHGVALNYDNAVLGNNGNAVTGNAPTFTTSDVIGVAIDITNGLIWYSKAGTFTGSPSAGTGGPVGGTITAASIAGQDYYPAICSAFGGFFTARFKTADFSFSPPSGFTSWQT